MDGLIFEIFARVLILKIMALFRFDSPTVFPLLQILDKWKDPV